MQKDKKNKLRSRILVEKRAKNMIIEFLNQSNISPRIEFKIEQDASNHLTNYLMKHNLWDGFIKWKEKQGL
jgi:hypothetical protein